MRKQNHKRNINARNIFVISGCAILVIKAKSSLKVSFYAKKSGNFGAIKACKRGLWVNYNIAGSLDSFSIELVKILHKNLKSGRQIKKDEENAKKINRDIICKKKVC